MLFPMQKHEQVRLAVAGECEHVHRLQIIFAVIEEYRKLLVTYIDNSRGIVLKILKDFDDQWRSLRKKFEILQGL